MKVDMSEEFDGLIEGEFDLSDNQAVLTRLLNPVFPEPEITPGGQPYFTPGQVKRLDALFARFGLSFNSTDDAFENLEYVGNLWYRLSEGFGTYITVSFLQPRIFKKEMEKWPADYRDYLAAVIADDRPKARELATKIRVEDLNAWMPKAFFG